MSFPTAPEHQAATWALYLNNLRKGVMPLTAARKLDITPDRLRKKRRNDPEFVLDEDYAMAEFAETMEQVLIDAALAPPPDYDSDTKSTIYHGPTKEAVAAAHLWLQSRAKAIFGRQNTESINVTHTIELSSVQDLFALQAKLQERRQNAENGGFLTEMRKQRAIEAQEAPETDQESPDDGPNAD